MRSPLRILAALFACGALSFHTGAALAQPPTGDEEPSGEELLAARQLFEEGQTLEQAGDWQGALGVYERVAQVKLTPNVRYKIARCHEELGRLVEAVNGYDLAAQEAKTSGKTAEKVLKNAPKRAADLRKKLGQIEIHIEGELRTSRVLIDGKSIAPVLLATAIPVDPGPHVVQLETAGSVAFEQDVDLGKGELATVDIEVHDPEPAPEPPPQPLPPPPQSALPADDPADPHVPAYVVGSLGLASLAAAGAMWGLREAAVSEVRDTCDANDSHCDPSLVGTADLGYSYQNAAFALLGVGGAALTTGVVLFFVLEPEEVASSDTPSKRTSVELGLAPTGLRLCGSFD